MWLVALHRIWSVHATFWIIGPAVQWSSSTVGAVDHLAHIRVPTIGSALLVLKLVLGLVRVDGGHVEVIAAVVGHVLHFYLAWALSASGVLHLVLLWYQLFLLRLLVHVKLLLLRQLHSWILISQLVHVCFLLLFLPWLLVPI